MKLLTLMTLRSIYHHFLRPVDDTSRQKSLWIRLRIYVRKTMIAKDFIFQCEYLERILTENKEIFL